MQSGLLFLPAHQVFFILLEKMGEFFNPVVQFVAPLQLVSAIPPGFEHLTPIQDQLNVGIYPAVYDLSRYVSGPLVLPESTETAVALPVPICMPIYQPVVVEPWQLVPPELIPDSSSESSEDCDFHKSRLASMVLPSPERPIQSQEVDRQQTYEDLVSSSCGYLVSTYSRKVFVGGLPKDICAREIISVFDPFGPLVVTWPNKYLERSEYPPKGYAFLIFHDEASVHNLVESCVHSEDKLFFFLSSSTVHLKATDVRPWRIVDSYHIMYEQAPVDVRKTVFVGGIPRTMKAKELAYAMNTLFGGVAYASIAMDHLLYPKGVGRVGFANLQSYIAAVNEKFAVLPVGDCTQRRVELRPYIMDNQQCDQCGDGYQVPTQAAAHSTSATGGRLASYYCTDINCLQYFCEQCWETNHSHQEPSVANPRGGEVVGRPIGYKQRHPHPQTTNSICKTC